MGNFFTRIRERSFAVALTVAAVLTFGALAARRLNSRGSTERDAD